MRSTGVHDVDVGVVHDGMTEWRLARRSPSALSADELRQILAEMSALTPEQLGDVVAPLISPAEAAAALTPIQQFLDYVGDDGLTLTSAGYLKPVDVEAACDMVPAMADWIGKNNREVQSVPLLEFRLGLQKLALTRKYKGRLLLTKVGAVPELTPIDFGRTWWGV